jgi:hypothetical protein
MKRVKQIVLCLVAMLLTLGVWEASAQHTYKFRDSLGTYKVIFTPNDTNTKFALSPTKPLAPRTHELRLSTSWGATNYWGEISNYDEIGYLGNDFSYDTSYYGPSHHYAINLEYGYWVNEWFSIGANATWLIGQCNIFNKYTHERVFTSREDCISIMPIARFAWYRQGMVQLYSSAGIGIGIERRVRYWNGKENLIDPYCAFDFKFLGLSVGKKWFGFAEVGYGARGVVNVGFGCRINDKVK